MNGDVNYNNNINYDRIAQEVKKIQQLNPENFSEKEAVKEVLKRGGENFEIDQKPVDNSQNSYGGIGQGKTNNGQSKSYTQDLTPEAREQIANLIKITLEKGLDDGIKNAQRLDPFLLDAFHDVLAEELVKEMKIKKLI